MARGRNRDEDEPRVGDALPKDGPAEPDEDDDALLPTDGPAPAQGAISEFVRRRQAQIGLAETPPATLNAAGDVAAPDEPALPDEPADDPLPDPVEKAGRYADPRADAAQTIARRLNARLQTIGEDGGEWNGIRVLTRRDLLEVMAEDLPAASIHAGTVTTPATLYVEAVCPRCHIPSSITASLSVELREDDNGAELKVKTKTKAKAHLCGQTRLPEPGPAGPDDVGTEPLAFDAPAPGAVDDEGRVDEPADEPKKPKRGRRKKAAEPETLAPGEPDALDVFGGPDEPDVRPTGEVNADELAGAAARDVQEAERSTDGAD